jgi:2-methylcitrate dehydratase PrpD
MVTQKLSEFIAGTHFDQIPTDAVHLAKSAMLDTIGCILGGRDEEASKLITAYAKELGGLPEAAVIGKGFKTNAHLAALVNGTTGHALDYDDTAYSWFGHPSVVLWPAILALAEKFECSGKTLLAAYIVGFEVGARIGQALGTDAYVAGWHNTSIIGAMAAAAACANLMSLDPQRVRMCLGMAGSLSGGLKQNFGTMTKPLHAGVAAQHGIMTALMAQKGFSANPDILDTPNGYGYIFSKNYDPENILKDIGTSFSISSDGLAFKPYPSCRGTHQCIDGVLHLVTKYNLDPEEVLKIECRIAPIIKQMLRYHNPRNALESKFSLEYCVARALVDREIRIEHFSDEEIHVKEIQKHIQKVTYKLKDDLQKNHKADKTLPPVYVSIQCKNGTEFSHEVETCRGDPENPLTHEELATKFRDCSRRMLTAEEANQCINCVFQLESMQNARSLMSLVA